MRVGRFLKISWRGDQPSLPEFRKLVARAGGGSPGMTVGCNAVTCYRTRAHARRGIAASASSARHDQSMKQWPSVAANSLDAEGFSDFLSNFALPSKPLDAGRRSPNSRAIRLDLSVASRRTLQARVLPHFQRGRAFLDVVGIRQPGNLVLN